MTKEKQPLSNYSKKAVGEPENVGSPEWWVWWQQKAEPGYFLPEGIIVEKDLPVEMRDGVKLAVNVYRPDKPGKFPVIMGITIFGKDIPWSEIHPGWGIAYDPYSPALTRTTAFEAPDPAFWVPHEYIVILVDQRGTGRSGGKQYARAQEAHAFDYFDYYDVIEWAGTREWSNGNVGLNGVSTFGMAQWAAASLNPPHLKAISPWEAFTSTPAGQPTEGIRGGIPETKFSSRIRSRIFVHSPAFPETRNEATPPPRRGSFDYLEDITVPALVCGTWSDHFVHTRGTMGGVFLAYEKISSKHKWLYTHGRQKWAEYYSFEALTIQKMFYDHFLKGTDKRMLDMPRVRLEVRDSFDRWTVRYENEWPIARTQYKKLYLNAESGILNFEKAAKESKITYDADLPASKATFDFKFEEDTELTGCMKLKLWVSPEDTDDMDIFVTVRKLADNGDEVYFESFNFPPLTYPVAFGLLRLSYRELDKKRSTPWRPFPTYKNVQKVSPGEIVPVEIEILASSTYFHQGESLRLDVSGKFQAESDMLGFDDLSTGNHSIYTGGKYDSYLLVPVIPEVEKQF